MRWGNENLLFHFLFLLYDKESTFSDWTRKELLAAEFCASLVFTPEKTNKQTNFSFAAEISGVGLVWNTESYSDVFPKM